MAVIYGWKLSSYVGKFVVLPEPQNKDGQLSMAAQAKAMETTLRGESNGVLGTALLIDCDKVLKRKADVLWALGRGLRHSLGKQGVFNKGFSNSKKYWQGLAEGTSFDTRGHVLQVL